MLNVKFFICKNCKSVLCVNKDFWNNQIRCTKCGEEVESVDDDFDLSQVIEDENVSDNPNSNS